MKLRDFGAATFMLTAALLVGCGEEPTTEVPTTTNAAELKGSGYCNTSFQYSFKNVSITYSGKAVSRAGASSCKRFDGSWGGSTNWSGFCTGDISNYNGRIQCN